VWNLHRTGAAQNDLILKKINSAVDFTQRKCHKMSDAPGLLEFSNSDVIRKTMESLHSIPTTKKTSKQNLMFSVVAFGDIKRRSEFLECIKYALDPTLFYSAYVKPVEKGEFEVLILSTKKVDMGVVEDWLDTFNMSACVIEFQHYMQADMVSCISRLHHLGNSRITNFAFSLPAKIRRDFHREFNKKKKADECRRLLNETGLHFTTENMFAMHVTIMTQRTLIQRLQTELSRERAAAERRDVATPPLRTSPRSAADEVQT